MKGIFVPYLCSVRISGPLPDEAGFARIMEAISTAVRSGWEAPKVVREDDEIGEFIDGPDDDGGSILDYRVLGYAGGAIILVVIDGADFVQASVAVSGLAQHLTTWSPALLEYSPEEVGISKIDKPYDEDNWLPPIDQDEPEERPRWRLAELVDDDVQALAAQYLLAVAVWSLWNPTDTTYGHGDRAADVVAGSTEPPWSGDLASALGDLLVSAARLERMGGIFADLTSQGGGSPELAADLLARARATALELATGGWTDDGMRGHLLLERFMEDHQLQWNRVPDEVPPSEADRRSDRQLKALLWAGLRALATMASPLRLLSGPWQISNSLGESIFTTILAAREAERREQHAEEDLSESRQAAEAIALVWLVIRRPDFLQSSAASSVIRDVSHDPSALHQVIHAAALMAGHDVVKAALADIEVPARIRKSVDSFAEALADVEREDLDGTDDPYGDMHWALERCMKPGPHLKRHIGFLLAMIGAAARLTGTDANRRRGAEGHVSSPESLTRYLLADPAIYSTAILHRDDENTAIRSTLLTVIVQMAPDAAGDLVAEFPELTGDDPRLEPAWRVQATRWVERALHIRETIGESVSEAEFALMDADAQQIVDALSEGSELPGEWAVERYVAGAVRAAASILHSTGTAHLAPEVFEQA